MKRIKKVIMDSRRDSPDETFTMKPAHFALKEDAFAGYEYGDNLSASLNGNTSAGGAAPVRFANYPEHGANVQIHKIRWQNKFYDDPTPPSAYAIPNYQVTLTVDQDSSANLTGGRGLKKIRFRNFDADTELTLDMADVSFISKPGRTGLDQSASVSWYWYTDHTAINNIFKPTISSVNVEFYYEEEYK